VSNHPRSPRRCLGCAQTPNPREEVSRKRFGRIVSRWRQSLHLWDAGKPTGGKGGRGGAGGSAGGRKGAGNGTRRRLPPDGAEAAAAVAEPTEAGVAGVLPAVTPKHA